MCNNLHIMSIQMYKTWAFTITKYIFPDKYGFTICKLRLTASSEPMGFLSESAESRITDRKPWGQLYTCIINSITLVNVTWVCVRLILLIWHIPTNNFASLRTIAVVVKRCFKYHWDKAKVEMAAFASVVVLKSIRSDEIVSVLGFFSFCFFF